MSERILIIVDFQNDFIQPDGVLSIKDVSLINRMQTFIDSLGPNSFVNIIITMDTHFRETWSSTYESTSYPLHCEFGHNGFKLAFNLSNTSNLPVEIIYKSTVDIWNEVSQYRCLNKDFKDSQIYISGLITEVCVKHALDGFLQRKAGKVFLLSDLIGGLNQTAEDLFLSEEYTDYVNHKSLCMLSSSDFLNGEAAQGLGDKLYFTNDKQ